MIIAEKAKQAILERVVELAKDATVSDLFELTDAIAKTTGENTKYADVLQGTLSKILEMPNCGQPNKKGNK